MRMPGVKRMKRAKSKRWERVLKSIYHTPGPSFFSLSSPGFPKQIVLKKKNPNCQYCPDSICGLHPLLYDLFSLFAFRVVIEFLVFFCFSEAKEHAHSQFSPIAYGKLYAPSLLMKIAVDLLSMKLKTENAKVQVWFYAIVCIPLFKMKSNCIFLVWITVNKTWVSFVLLGEAQQWWVSCWTQCESSRRDRIMSSASPSIK